MKTEEAKTAIDIIYSLPAVLDNVLAKLALLEARNAMLEQKINMLLQDTRPTAAAPPTDAPPQSSASDVESEEHDEAEVMEIRPQASQPFAFDNKVEKAEAPPLAPPVKSQDAIKIPSKEVDPMPQNAIPSEPTPEKQTSTLIRGRLKEREGSSIAAVDVKIFDDKSVMVKKTKTAATGEWIAMLPPGEYTAEFTKPGQKPLFKPISIVSGKKELEILI